MRHYENSIQVRTTPSQLFDYVDDFRRFSSHMSESSWMMGGTTMDISIDEGEGKKIGSVVRMGGKVLGIPLYLEEVVTEHNPPHTKAWETIGQPRLLVIGHYRMRLKIEPKEDGSHLQISIDYELPQTKKWLGKLFGKMYAKWCVRQMIDGVRKNYA